MTLSVERICNELNRNGLLPLPHLRNLHQPSLHEAGAAVGDHVSFVR